MNGSPLLTQRPPWIVGHRGAAAEAVENTLESLELAVAQGADMVELDVQLTADGHLVAFHDATLERLAGSSAVIEDSPRDLLLDHFEPLVTLPEVLKRLPSETPLNVEIKCRGADPERLVARLAADLGRRGRVLLSSFDWELLALIRVALPERPLAPIGKLSATDLLAATDHLRAWSLHCHRGIAEEIVAAAAPERRVLAYTVNEIEEARLLLKLGVAGVFTDAPGRLRAELGA